MEIQSQTKLVFILDTLDALKDIMSRENNCHTCILSVASHGDLIK